MIVSVTIGDRVEFPDTCPFRREYRGSHICGHPDIEASKSLYCEYTHTPSSFVEPPTRCYLLKHPIDGIKVEVRLK